MSDEDWEIIKYGGGGLSGETMGGGAEGEKPSSEPSATLWGSPSQSVLRATRAGDPLIASGKQRHRTAPTPSSPARPWEQTQHLQIHVAEYKCFLCGEGREGSHS